MSGWHPPRVVTCLICGQTFTTTAYNRAPLCDQHLAEHKRILLRKRQQRAAMRLARARRTLN